MASLTRQDQTMEHDQMDWADQMNTMQCDQPLHCREQETTGQSQQNQTKQTTTLNFLCVLSKWVLKDSKGAIHLPECIKKGTTIFVQYKQSINWTSIARCNATCNNECEFWTWLANFGLNVQQHTCLSEILPERLKLYISAGRLQNFFIVISNNSDGSAEQQCGFDATPFLSCETRVYSCPPETTGRYVRIRFPITHVDFLQLCEVQVQPRGNQTSLQSNSFGDFTHSKFLCTWEHSHLYFCMSSICQSICRCVW